VGVGDEITMVTGDKALDGFARVLLDAEGVKPGRACVYSGTMQTRCKPSVVRPVTTIANRLRRRVRPDRRRRARAARGDVERPGLEEEITWTNH
jgi:hypothetical protein